MRIYSTIRSMVHRSFLAPALRPLVRIGRTALEMYRNATASVNSDLVLVVAHPRSGTTAVATLLAKHTGLRVFTMTGGWTMADKDIISGRITMDEVISRNRFAFSCDVMATAGAGCFLPTMKAALPKMRVVFLVRNPRDMICSVIERINDYDISRIEVSDFNYRYFNIDWLGITERDPIKKLALRWNRWLEVAHSVEGVLYRRYEDFLKDKPGFVGNLAEELGLAAQYDIRDAMNRQVSKNGNVPIRGAGRWKDMLPVETAGTIERICEKVCLNSNIPSSCSRAPKPPKARAECRCWLSNASASQRRMRQMPWFHAFANKWRRIPS